MIDIIAYFFAVLVGVSLGLIGSGGSILTVPILVYLMGVNPVLATAYSLFIVGTTSLVGGIKSALNGMVDFKTVIGFGIPSIITVYLTRLWLVPFIPNEIFTLNSFVLTKNIALMILFAIVMILASVSMIKKGKTQNDNPQKRSYLFVILEGVVVGVLTGLVGAGGGFLIIPALVLLAGMSMKLAVGTSLFIIAAKSLIGFIGDVQTTPNIDWSMLLLFTLFSIIGIFLGILLSKKIDGSKLKKAFGYFVLVMGIYIIVKELFI